MHFIISLLIGYLIGSFPTAYIVIKKYRKIDITAAGTGNVGAMNSYDVSKSKLIGIVVFLIDFVKGMLPVLILKFFGYNNFAVLSVSLLACIFAHCYNPWLNLKGGRGLASAAGGTAIIFPFILVVWSILWLIFYLFKKDITIANVTASIMSLIITMISSEIAIKYAFPKPESESILIIFCVGLFILILSKHTEPLQELSKNAKLKKGILL